MLAKWRPQAAKPTWQLTSVSCCYSAALLVAFGLQSAICAPYSGRTLFANPAEHSQWLTRSQIGATNEQLHVATSIAGIKARSGTLFLDLNRAGGVSKHLFSPCPVSHLFQV